MKKKYFYDTEFNENGATVELISIGIVCEDGRTLYQISNEFDVNKAVAKTWIKENVLHSIHKELYPSMALPNSDFRLACNLQDALQKQTDMVKTLDKIAADILAFIGDDTPELWAYCGAFDHVLLVQLLKGFDNMPETYPYFTHDLAQLAESCGIDKLPDTNPNIHHALSDAVWCKNSYEFIQADIKANYDGE